ncbi:MAG: VOC family protein [bacterium]
MGVEHVGLYPRDGVLGAELANWYSETFGFELKEGGSSFFVSGAGPGRIEVMKESAPTGCHIAIRVSDFEGARKALEGKGIKVEETKVRGRAKSAFLAGTDPAGNRVHLLYTP